MDGIITVYGFNYGLMHYEVNLIGQEDQQKLKNLKKWEKGTKSNLSTARITQSGLHYPTNQLFFHATHFVFLNSALLYPYQSQMPASSLRVSTSKILIRRYPSSTKDCLLKSRRIALTVSRYVPRWSASA